MRRRIVAALAAGAAGLALGVMPTTGAFASSDGRADYGCSDWRGWDRCDHHDHDNFFFHHRNFDHRNFDDFNDVVVIFVGLR
ncbi:hypothetical protein ACWGI8_37955 [Streptomyces sp. NPDC054841]